VVLLSLLSPAARAQTTGGPGPAADIRDIKPLVRVPLPLPWGWIALAAVALLALVLLAYWLWRRRRAAPAAPQLPAHEVAFAALDRLAATDFADRIALRRAYFELSEVIRAYVEASLGINATDLTSEEIVRRLPAVSGLDPLAGERLRRFLADTDRVKFAASAPDGRWPGPHEIGETFEQARAFVDATRPREPVEAAA
jgi:hypothetical protein